MAATDSAEIEARSADRIVVFSDAVVAIAITLLDLSAVAARCVRHHSRPAPLRSPGNGHPPRCVAAAYFP